MQRTWILVGAAVLVMVLAPAVEALDGATVEQCVNDACAGVAGKNIRKNITVTLFKGDRDGVVIACGTDPAEGLGCDTLSAMGGAASGTCVPYAVGAPDLLGLAVGGDAGGAGFVCLDLGEPGGAPNLAHPVHFEGRIKSVKVKSGE